MTSPKHQPALALPWRVLPSLVSKETTPRVASDSGGVALMLTCRFLGEKSPSVDEKRNAAYIAHAANAYPRQIDAAIAMLSALDAPHTPCRESVIEMRREELRALLRELREIE